MYLYLLILISDDDIIEELKDQGVTKVYTFWKISDGYDRLQAILLTVDKYTLPKRT